MTAALATLHDAIIEVLSSHGGDWMSRDEIAQEIAQRDLWRRPSDGAHPPSDQLRLRARRYPHLFEGSDPNFTRLRLRSGAVVSLVPRPTSHQEVQPAHAASREVGDSWYEELRSRYRPERVEVLLIGESPPDAEGGDRRFFYVPELSRFDNLYRGVAGAVYGLEPDFDLTAKEAVLDRLTRDGFWLIDAVERPVNKLSRAERRAAITAGAPRLVERCSELAPERGVIICHSLVYELAASALLNAGVRILHTTPLPFPLGNWRARFVSGMRLALNG